MDSVRNLVLFPVAKEFFFNRLRFDKVLTNIQQQNSQRIFLEGGAHGILYHLYVICQQFSLFPWWNRFVANSVRPLLVGAWRRILRACLNRREGRPKEIYYRGYLWRCWGPEESGRWRYQRREAQWRKVKLGPGCFEAGEVQSWLGARWRAGMFEVDSRRTVLDWRRSFSIRGTRRIQDILVEWRIIPGCT